METKTDLQKLKDTLVVLEKASYHFTKKTEFTPAYFYTRDNYIKKAYFINKMKKKILANYSTKEIKQVIDLVEEEQKLFNKKYLFCVKRFNIVKANKYRNEYELFSFIKCDLNDTLEERRQEYLEAKEFDK